MPKQLRRRILFFLIAIFLVLGTGVVLYAQGWRASFKPLGFGKVGAIYIRTFPADTALTLNGKPRQKKSGFFEKGGLLGDLLPGEYTVEAAAAGFQPWRRPVIVTSSLVASLQNVVLIPLQPIQVTSTPVRGITLAGPTLILDTATGTRTLSGLPLPGNGILAASEDGLMVVNYASGTRAYFLTDIARSTSTALTHLPGQAAAKTSWAFQPVRKDNTLFLVHGPNSLHLLRVPAGGAVTLSTSSVTAAASAPGRVVWSTFATATDASFLSSYDIPSRNFNRGFEFVPGQISLLSLGDAGAIFALATDGSLYSLNLNRSSRLRLAENVRSFVLSKDDDKLAVLDGQGARIFFLREDKLALQIPLPAAASIRRLTWYRDGMHLFVQYPDAVAFLDITDPKLDNFPLAAAAARAEYEPNDNALYFLKDGLLQKMVFAES